MLREGMLERKSEQENVKAKPLNLVYPYILFLYCQSTILCYKIHGIELWRLLFFLLFNLHLCYVWTRWVTLSFLFCCSYEKADAESIIVVYGCRVYLDKW